MHCHVLPCHRRGCGLNLTLGFLRFTWPFLRNLTEVSQFLLSSATFSIFSHQFPAIKARRHAEAASAQRSAKGRADVRRRLMAFRSLQGFDHRHQLHRLEFCSASNVGSLSALHVMQCNSRGRSCCCELHLCDEFCRRGSHARLKGAVNDAWNMHTMLRLETVTPHAENAFVCYPRE